MTDHDLIGFGIWHESDEVVTDDEDSESTGLLVPQLTRVADQLNREQVT